MPRRAPLENSEPDAEWKARTRQSIERELWCLMHEAEEELHIRLSRARDEMESKTARAEFDCQKRSITRIAEELFVEKLGIERSRRRGGQLGGSRGTHDNSRTPDIQHDSPDVATRTELTSKAVISQPTDNSDDCHISQPSGTPLGDQDHVRSASEPDEEWRQDTRMQIAHDLQPVMDDAESALTYRLSRARTEDERRPALADYEQQKQSLTRIAEELFIEKLREERARRGLLGGVRDTANRAPYPTPPPSNATRTSLETRDTRNDNVMHSDAHMDTTPAGSGHGRKLGPQAARLTPTPDITTPLAADALQSALTSRASTFAALSPASAVSTSGETASTTRQRLTLYPRAGSSARAAQHSVASVAIPRPMPSERRSAGNSQKPAVTMFSSIPIVTPKPSTPVPERPRRPRAQPQPLPHRPASFDPLTHP